MTLPVRLPSSADRWACGIALLFGLQSLRGFAALSTFVLHDVRRWPPLWLLAVMAAFFSAALLAGPLSLRLGRRRARLLVAILLVGTRAAEQLIVLPEIDVWLAGLGSSLFWMLLSLLSERTTETDSETAFPVILLAVFADATLLVSVRSLDLSWQPLGIGIWIVGPLAVAALLFAWRALRRQAPMTDDDRRSIPPPLALGAWLVLQYFLFQNPAAVAARSGLDLDVAGLYVLAANAAALLLLYGAWPRLSGTTGDRVSGAALVVSILLVRLEGSAAAAAVLLGTPSACLALGTAFARSSGLRARRWLSSLGAPVVFLVLLFSYYGTFRFGGSLAREVMPVVAALVVIVGRPRVAADRVKSKPAPPPRATRPQFVGLLIALSLLPAAGILGTARHPTTEPAERPSLRIATYNLHQGFDVRGRLSIERLAEDIEKSGADVVALQEVSRGWVVDGSLDTLSWLSRRLGMRAVFGPTADAQWGNALLTRVPVLAHSAHPLPPRTLPLLRGFLDVTVTIDGRPIRILATHLHHRNGDDSIRTAQVRALLDAWAHHPRTLVLGDLNSRPGSKALSLLRGAGFADAAIDLPTDARATHFRSQGPQQIDYILGTRDLQFRDPVVSYSGASDHAIVSVTVESP